MAFSPFPAPPAGWFHSTLSADPRRRPAHRAFGCGVSFGAVAGSSFVSAERSGPRRGARGGYELARERRRITVGEIVRTAMSLSTADPDDLGSNSVLLERVIDPAVRRAGETFLANLDAITIEQMCDTAEKTHVLDDEKVSGDFAT